MRKYLLSVALAAFIPAAFAAAPASVQKLPSGVTVEQLVKGTGVQPSAGDTVSVHYRGTLADGNEFDSSYRRGTPATFSLKQVVPCWQEGIPALKVGSKARLTCPSKTAYGERGIPGVIPPNSTLTFDIELLSVKQ